MKRPTDNLIHKNTLMRGVFFGLGVVFLALGLIGVVVPGMPTTVFVLLAGYCWARSSQRFYEYLLSHQVFGKILTDWQERRAMPRFAKYLAWAMMAISTVVMFIRLPDDWLWLGVVMAVVSVLVAIWMARLPDA
ncbi:YbaN family protein [Moraxella porci]|uniref:YbaN family protein n=1 Tax=Moraxella porci TaxID=1288392 RepID=UPI00244A782E|nr:YbaN family protein [Moraxella porci]MDH2273184.1 YbaN family protein [Moraxella porci]